MYELGRNAAIAAALALALCGCGGGGGGESAGVAQLALSPSTLNVTLYQGDTRQYEQRFTVGGLGSGDAYVFITDPAAVLAGSPEIYREETNVFSVRFQFRPTLAVRHHTGTFSINVCADAGCGSRTAVGTLPHDIHVLSHSNLTPLTPLAGASDWTNRQGGLAHLGYVPATLNPAQFSARWLRTLPGAASSTGDAPQVTTADDRVYAVYRNSIVGIEEADAGVPWSATVLTHWASPAAYADGSLYVVNQEYPQTPVLEKFDAAAGARTYMKSFPQPAYGNFGVRADWPLVAGDQVFFATGHTGYYGGLYAFRTSDGEYAWNQYEAYSPVAPAIAGGRTYYFGSRYGIADSTGLVALNQATGAHVATIPHGEFVSCGICVSSPAIDGNEAFVNTSERVVAYDLVTAEEKWSVAGVFRTHPDNAPAVTPDTVYVAKHGTPLQLLALSREDGSTLWSWSPAPYGIVGTPPGGDASDDAFISSVVATDNVVFVSTERATYAVSATTHQTVWAYPYPGRLAISANGILYVARSQLHATPISGSGPTSDGYLAAINLH